MICSSYNLSYDNLAVPAAWTFSEMAVCNAGSKESYTMPEPVATINWNITHSAMDEFGPSKLNSPRPSKIKPKPSQIQQFVFPKLRKQ
jgi:hypothetical protein